MSGVLASLVWCGNAGAQSYPSGTVTIVVPFTPGGSTDILGRLAAEVLQKEYGGSFVVENRTGAGGVIGYSSVARAAPDGHTLLLAPTAFTIVPFISKNVPYDTARDLAPITLMGLTANIMVVAPTLGPKTVAEFIAFAKASPNPITYASPGLGTPTHLGVEVFARQTGIAVQHVVYRGAAPALTDVMTGNVTMMFVDLAPAVPLVQAGKLKALGALTPKRHASLPDLPAVSETVAGFHLPGWQGLLAPAGTPEWIIDKINAAVVAYLKTPAAEERLRNIGIDVKWTTPKEMREWIDGQLAYWSKVAKDAGMVAQ